MSMEQKIRLKATVFYRLQSLKYEKYRLVVRFSNFMCNKYMGNKICVKQTLFRIFVTNSFN